MKAIKKSVRLVDNTIKLCHELTKQGETNWSGSINAMAEQYKAFVTECLPTLSDNEKTAFYCAYNGYMPHPDLETELNQLHWNISEGYQYDEQIRDVLGTKEQAIEFIERIQSWSKPEKMAVIYMARAFWRQGQIPEPEND
jgi:hypothetical protein